MKLLCIFVSLFLFSATSNATHHERNAALKEIEKTFGLVPKFYSAYPPEGVVGAWEEMKNFELNPNTALSGVYKELIGLAVASQIPCHYCAYFHTQAAKLNGGNDQQVKEAIAISGITRLWGAWFSGMQLDKKEFMKETDKIMEIQKERMKPGYKAPVLPPIEVTDAESANKDIERNMGLVPYFVGQFPKKSFAGSWLNIKGLFFNPSTAIPVKIKALIGLAVSAQSNDKFGVYWDTEMAKVNGATEQEISEAVEMAGLTRHWSTWLNGNLFEEKAFKKEADKIFAHLKKQAAKKK
jgi:AhpD family alkylhydroperoxidase